MIQEMIEEEEGESNSGFSSANSSSDKSGSLHSDSESRDTSEAASPMSFPAREPITTSCRLQRENNLSKQQEIKNL